MCQTRGKFFDFTLSAVFATQCDDGLHKQSNLGVVYTHLENQRRKEGNGESAELMMPTLRDSTMSHPGENSHQVRVKAYYKG